MIKRRAAAAGLPPLDVLPRVPGDGDRGQQVEAGDPVVLPLPGSVPQFPDRRPPAALGGTVTSQAASLRAGARWRVEVQVPTPRGRSAGPAGRRRQSCRATRGARRPGGDAGAARGPERLYADALVDAEADRSAHRRAGPARASARPGSSARRDGRRRRDAVRLAQAVSSRGSNSADANRLLASSTASASMSRKASSTESLRIGSRTVRDGGGLGGDLVAKAAAFASTAESGPLKSRLWGLQPFPPLHAANAPHAGHRSVARGRGRTQATASPIKPTGSAPRAVAAGSINLLPTWAWWGRTGASATAPLVGARPARRPRSMSWASVTLRAGRDSDAGRTAVRP